MAKTELLAARLAAQHGVVSREWLQKSGFTTGEIRQMRESGRLVDAHRGVYLSSSAPRTQQQRMVDLVLYCDGVISHITAGQLWGLRKLSRYRDIHLSIMRGELVHPDVAEPSRRFIVEVDHAEWHSRREASQYDRWRDRQYHLLGWHSERVSDRDIDERLPETVKELSRIYWALPSVGA